MARLYFYNGFRADAPPLGYPAWADLGDLIKIPDEWTVWAVADLHGVLDPFRAALAEAGLADRSGRWIGGPNIALVSLGDAIDRGPDSAGLMRYLRGLEVEMAKAGSRLVRVRGNHEQMLADILRGCDEWFDSWRANGGAALARSFGLARVAHGFSSFVTALIEAEPGLLPWLLETLPCARWRDVVFVHAGLPPGGTIGTLLISDKQLWDPESWFVSSAGLALEPDLWGLSNYGMGRVVIGHYPQHRGPTVEHDGTLLLLDSNAAGLPTLDGRLRTSFVSLARLAPSGSLEASKFVLVDVPGRS
jgi:hypothetical protein